MFGEQVPTTWNPDEYYGRKAEFTFTIGDCFQNCKACQTKGLSLDDQKCRKCIDGYYFVEDTQNCFENPPIGYYFNEDEEIYSKCYEKCKTCSGINQGEIHNCLSCYENYLLYKNTNCLNCKYLGKYVNYLQTKCINSVPDGYYVNDTEYNTIDKCHENCLTCNTSPEGDNMNCLTCDKANKFYLLGGTSNCVRYPYPHHYLDDDNIIKPCHYSCESCSAKPLFNDYGEVTNCDSCNNDFGFYPISDTNTCINETRDGLFFDEECKCYKHCHDNCLTCSSKEFNQYHMNCLTCDSSKGFTYFKKTTNCLNCKSLGKYVNYEQTI